VRRTDALTLIEILVSLALLGILSSFVVSSLTSSMGVTRQSRSTLDATTTVQRIVEEVRGQWLEPRKFDAGCVEDVVLEPPNTSRLSVKVKQQDLNDNLEPIANRREEDVVVATACDRTVRDVCDPMIKRLTVTARDAADATRVLSQVVLDIDCPVRP
jgi:prepilin-type N-terminal cleavage/methylation domain-containing protein